MSNFKSTEKPKLKYACIGDSISYGDRGENNNTSWCDYLKERLEITHYSKKAVNGATVVTQPGRNKLITQINEIPINYDGLITCLIGVNDYNVNPQITIGDFNEVLTKDYNNLIDDTTFIESYRYAMETLKRKCPQARIIAIAPLYTSWLSASGIPLAQFVLAIQAVCSVLEIEYVDISPIWIKHNSTELNPDNTNISADNLHPNWIGYKIIANYMYNYICR